MSRLYMCLLSALLLSCVFASSFIIEDALVAGLAACRPDQIQALMHFKNEFDSRGCNHTDYVKGVSCSNVTGAVKELELPKVCLSGTLKPNSSLFQLHHLRYLDLSNNNFTSSSLPSSFGNLNKLEVLSLSLNGFIGQVPSSFSNLSHLSILDLSQNELTGSFPLVQNLTKLSFLMLSYNKFTGTIHSSLLMMPFLSSLNLHENHLTGPIEIPNSSSRLETLFLGKNHFKGQILEPISKLINLKDLDLSFLNTSYPVDLRIFSSLKYLLDLDLSGNSILPASLSSNSYIPLNLEVLSLSRSDINEFPNILKTLQNLQMIIINHNRIKGKVPKWLWNLPHLNIVDLVHNSFNGFEGSAAVLVNSSVRMLNLGFNRFKGEFPIPPLSINFLSALHNSFTGSIPCSTCNRNSLTYLDLSYNNFTGPILPCLSKFVAVNLRKNNLEGRIPDMFYAGTSLQTLNVGYNQLTGKLPRSLLSCSFLDFLSVENNKIEDMFPFWLKYLPNLQVFILRSNKFYGPISPPHQGLLAFPELRILEISDNNFTGSLPPSYFVNWKASLIKRNEHGSIYMEFNKKTSKHTYYTYE